METDPPRSEIEEYWKSIWEKEGSRNTNAQGLTDLSNDHSNLQEQHPINIRVADIQERVSRIKTWTAQNPDMIHSNCLRTITDVGPCSGLMK